MKRLYKSLLVGAAFLAPMAGWAAVDTTHHDMPTYLTAAVTTEKCAYGHSKTVTDLAADQGMGTVGVFCVVVCHDGLTVGGAAVAGPGLINPINFTTTAPVNTGVGALTGSHGLDQDIFFPPLDAAAGAPANAIIAATGWPHSNESKMQCTTCHAVHDGSNPPFLNGPMATTVNTTAFCNRCHTGAAGLAAGNAGRWANIADEGAHPTEFVFQADGSAGPDADPTKGGRILSFKAPLVRAASVPAAVDVASFNLVKGNAWRLGGHLMDTATKLPIIDPTAPTATTVFGCYSCHSAHQADEGGTNLILSASLNQARTNGDSSAFCVACHGASPAVITDPIWNVGDTAYGHPANETAAKPYQHDHEIVADPNPTIAKYGHGNVHPNVPNAGFFPVDVEDLTVAGNRPAGLTANEIGADGEILCVSCHAVHGGVQTQMAIRNIGGMANADTICKKCHGIDNRAGFQPNGGAGINRHHPTVDVSDIDATYNTAVGALPWRDGNNNQTMNDGLSCPDCHTYTTAHNW